MGVYFIGEYPDGPIKIGVANQPLTRLRNLQVGNPRDLELLGWFLAPPKTERFLHDLLAAHHIRGEWFKAHAEVLGALEACMEVFETNVCDECARIDRYRVRRLDPGPQSYVHTCKRPSLDLEVP